jgi:hypothetical protein
MTDRAWDVHVVTLKAKLERSHVVVPLGRTAAAGANTDEPHRTGLGGGQGATILHIAAMVVFAGQPRQRYVPELGVLLRHVAHEETAEVVNLAYFFFIKEAFIRTSEAIHRVDTKPKRVTSSLCLT